MADSQPESKEQKPSKSSRPHPKPGVTSADVRANPSFTVHELIDLALCSPEVGAVNFNILRMLLREIVGKTGIDKAPVKMNDVEAHQVENFRNYMQGTSVASPMPGVLRIGQQGAVPVHGGPSSNNNSARQPGQPGQPQQQQGGPPGQAGPGPRGPQTPRTPPKPASPGGLSSSSHGYSSHGIPQDIVEKVLRLEQQLESLYQLPANAELLEKAKAGGASMSVNDMWQIIQLNNRIAAAEAAIQKMASLIEDLAKNMGKVKGDAKILKRDAEGLLTTTSDIAIQGQDLSDKYDRFRDVIFGLQKEITEIKMGWKNDRENMEKVLGVDLGKVPSFMKPKPMTEREYSPVGMDGETPSTQFERGTQTFMKKQGDSSAQKPRSKPKKAPEQYIPPQEIAKMSPEEIMKNITPEELNQMTPGVYKELTPDQKKALNEIRKSGKHSETPKPMGVARMSINEIVELPIKDIQEKMTFEDAMSLPPEALTKMTKEQKVEVQKIIDRGPPKMATSRRDLSKPKQKMGVAQMNQEQVQAIPAEQIAKQMSPEEAKSLPPQVLEQMSPEQKAAVQKVIQKGTKGPGVQKKPKKQEQPSLGIVSMTQDQLNELSPEKIAKDLTFEEAQNIPEKVMEKMTPAQRDAIRKTIQAGPPPGYKEKATSSKKPNIGVASMNTDELKEISEKEIAEMPYEEAKKIPPAILAQMSPEQKQAIEKIVALGPDTDEDDEYYEEFYEEPPPQPKKHSGEKRRSRLSEDQVKTMAEVPAEKIAATITPEQAAAISPEEMKKRFTPQQIQELEKLRKEQKRKSDSLKGQDGKLDVEQAAEMTPSELISNLTEEHLEGLTDEEIDSLPPAQAKAVKEFRKSLEEEEDFFEDELWQDKEDSEERYSVPHQTKETKEHKEHKRPERHRHHREKGKSKHHKKRSEEDLQEELDHGHTHVDVVKGPIPTAGQPLPPMTLEEYLSQLPPEEAANLAADAVQKELEKQYKHLQGMQRQLAQDIQDKMEFIYQKLLKEIATQHETTSPYMAIGGPETCLGPGICTGHGMPAGIAVCQFPEASKGKGKTGEDQIPDGQVCPGPGVCPGSDICPYCKADSQARDALLALKGAEKIGVGDVSPSGKALTSEAPKRISELDEALLQEMKSLMMLDLEKIRDDMRSKKFGAYDEQDIVERLGAVWEALKILKYNEEALAVKIARQDAFMKKIPPKTMDKLRKIPDENLDALITGNLGKMGGMSNIEERRATLKEALDLPQVLRTASNTGAGGGGADREDIQTLFNNLANVIAECAEQKDRIDQLSDTARILESGMVTKQMLVDALSDKADRGLINTKVSYDEFGNTIDELHTQLHNLMVEGYQRNENWKKVTADLAAELADKLDKVELAPIRAFFKSHLKTLEEKVRNLSLQIEEPDPAGTRKKLLKDYNCLSCDRMVNISGVTNGPTLPTIGPMLAGHTTASKRALDLHRMRMAKKFDPDRKNLSALEKQGKMNKAKKQPPNSARISNDMDIVSVVNRYTGGSHTNVTNADIVAATHKSTQGPDPINTILPEAGAAGGGRSNSQTEQIRQSGEKLAAV